MQKLTIYNMHVLDAPKQIPDNSIDCIVTSPPYYGLRWYGNEADAIWGGKTDCEHEWIAEKVGLLHENRNNLKGSQEQVVGGTGTTFINKYNKIDVGFCAKCGAWEGQLGLEPDYHMYLDHLMQITAELQRVLKPSGTLWWNMGDTYNGNKEGKTDKKVADYVKDSQSSLSKMATKSMPSKCLMQIPARFAMRMVDEQGWVLRDDVCWFKPNHMPSSVKDRLSNSWEHIYLFTKSKKYFFNLDAIREPPSTHENRPYGIIREREFNYNSKFKEIRHYKTKIETALERHGSYEDPLHTKPLYPLGKNPGDVWKISPMQQRRTLSWANNYHDKGHDKKYKYNGDDFWTLTTKPYSGAHFATFPPELPERCIKAGGPKDGVVLDPFAGSGTTLAVALQLGRDAIGIEINPNYIKLIEKRTNAIERSKLGALEYELIKVLEYG